VPELPEVETVVREIRPDLEGRRITGVTLSDAPLRNPWDAAWAPRLLGKTVRDVSRRGKWIVVALKDGERLLFHLGMTGQMTVVPVDEPVKPHTHVTLNLSPGKCELRFCDIRRFGGVLLHHDEARLSEFFREAALGPEPFDLDADYWRQRLSATERCLKAVLLDQRVVAGVGNIYADESLFEARLHPARLASGLTAPEADRLRRAVAVVLTRAIEKRGSSIRNYVGGSGLRGSYQDEFRAYKRTGKPCRRCRTPITATRLAGRSTHYCPGCQKKD
jgi:formamidopyrimidine-DNA glycosylase